MNAHPMLLKRIMTPSSQTCEDLEDADSLRHLFAIMGSAIMLNDTSLLEMLLAEEAVMVRHNIDP